MFCANCGNKASEGSVFCQKCGTKVAYADTAQQTSNTSISTVEPSAANIVDPSHNASVMPVKTIAQEIVPTDNGKDFREFVDNHVRATTKFQSAKDLLENSKPLTIIWKCFVSVALVFFVVGLINGRRLEFFMSLQNLLGIGFCGCIVLFFTCSIIKTRYDDRFQGKFTGDININDLFIFLNEHLKHIHPDFHEWGYFSSKAGFLATVEKPLSSGEEVPSLEQVRICSEFGPNRKYLVSVYIMPKTADANPGEKLYCFDAVYWIILAPYIAVFLGYGIFIRTAPILQAAMEYYLKATGSQGPAASIQE